MKREIVGKEVDQLAEGERVNAHDGSKEEEDGEKGKPRGEEEEKVAEKEEGDESEGPQRVGEEERRLGAGERETEEGRWNEGASLDGQSGWERRGCTT